MRKKKKPGQVITFYSYKGGTGRSMALANVAWILASNGLRVLVVDWDLEAPGLHHYFAPFLVDAELRASDGVIDFVIDFAAEAVTPLEEEAAAPAEWLKERANILRYAVSLEWDFPEPGTLDFVSAGRQGASYATRVNSFNWQDFYERMGGGLFIEAVKEVMKSNYDYVLIDSRTGVSDTSGICTVQLPDSLAVCFTLNNQGIEGAAAVANSVQEQRGPSGVRIFPIPTRVESAEKERLDRARDLTKQRFGPFLWHVLKEEQDAYWGKVEIIYQPYYAYEEILSTFGDPPGHTNSLLASMERITSYLTGGEVKRVGELDEAERLRQVERYARRDTRAQKDARPSASQTERPPAEPRLPTQSGAVFISYPSERKDFALRLADALSAGPPEIPTWVDARDIRPGDDWDAQVAEAIRVCRCLIFVMSRSSVAPDSVNKAEWTRALKYKKPIIPVRLDADAEMPFRLEPLQFVDFTASFEAGLARLVNRLEWQLSPAGQLAALKYRLADSERDLVRSADPVMRARIEDDVKALREEIEALEAVVKDPEAAARRVAESIERGLERERKPERAAGVGPRSKFINSPPGVAPVYFQNRHVETKLLGEFLKEDSLRMMTVVGRGGTGKTALVCRLLKSLEGGQLPDEGGALEVDGIVYLSNSSSRRVTTPNLYADLSKLLPEEAAAHLDELYKNPHVGIAGKMAEMLSNFPQGRTVLLLDNFEDLVDPETLNVRDRELDEALRALLEAAQHTVKVIITTRIAPRDLMLSQPGRQARMNLDAGLASPYAENILREMDADGKAGLRDAPDEVLHEARQRTRGYPRALEALFAILSVDRDTSLREILDDATDMLPENVVKDLVGEAFYRLDPAAQRAMQALAVYRHPVTPAAVDYLLQPHLPGVNNTPVLTRLVNMQFARSESRRYSLHPVDRAYAFSRIPRGGPADREAETPPYTQFGLLHRAAEYFKQARLPREDAKAITDLAPQLAEFDLRCEGEDYDEAGRVLSEIDFDYLLTWGFYQLVAEMHERLRGKIGDRDLRARSVGILGAAYLSTGQIKRAVASYEEALKLAREVGNRSAEGLWLGNLGACYLSLGESARAAQYFEQALVISRDIAYRLGEAIQLGNLGLCYSDMGQTARAVEYSERSLVICRELGYRQGEGIQLSNLAGEMIAAGDYAAADSLAREGIKIGEEIKSPFIGSHGNGNLALALLHTGNLDGARRAAEAGRLHDEPNNNHHVLALLGLIDLMLADVEAAAEAFEAAAAQADAMLRNSAENLNALDSKGLALCGLAVCGQAGLAAEAAQAYRAARAINKDVGVVGRVLRLFDALAEADKAGVLAGVRAAAAGEE